MKKFSLSVFLILFMFVLIGCKNNDTNMKNSLVITEMCTSNRSSIYIDNYLYLDYIKIFNESEKSICIGGYGVSNCENDLFKYTFMNGIWIGPNDYVIIYFSKEYTGENWLVANFDISEEDEYIYLTSLDGEIISKIKNVKFIE